MGEVSIRIAKTAGFCFGVARAIKLCEDLIENATPAVTLGPIIHNRQVTKAFEERGLRAVSSPKEADGAVLVIRSHGVGPKVYAEIDELSLRFVDATCPDVAAIQKKVQTGREEGRTVLIAGDKNHPEVVGIMGFAGENCHVFETREELCEKIFPETGDVPVLVVAQTTFNLLQYKVLQEAVKALYSDVTVYDTVCRATVERQAEARRLSERCDVCIVVGDKDSSNTRKLLDICGKKAVTYSVESKDELKAFMLRGVDVVGVTAGASTPAPVIEEVLERMDEMIKENGDTVAEVEEVGEVEVSEQVPDIAAEEPETGVKEEEFNFETALEDSLRPVHRNQRVIGVVTQIRPNEVVVDIGSKHTGIIPVEELSDDSSKEPSDIVSVGDKLNLLVIGTNDQEGITTLSKKRLDSSEGLDLLTTAAEEGTILDAYVTELVNKGLIAVIKGVRVFVPASQATLRHGADYDKLLRTNVRIKILEVNPARRRAIGSIRAVLQEELAVKREAFWESVEVGKEYTGMVKSLTSYGAFVDLGGVDGMVHISELSWQRVKNPAEVVSIGDEITVYVREIDRERRRISLGYRKEEDNPWKTFEANYTIGDVFPAKVVSLTKFGAFVRIIPGIDGLVHISEISREHVEKASDMLAVGDDVMVKLIDVENEKKRISLSMRYEGAPVLERKPGRKPARDEKQEISEPEEEAVSAADEAAPAESDEAKEAVLSEATQDAEESAQDAEAAEAPEPEAEEDAAPSSEEETVEAEEPDIAADESEPSEPEVEEAVPVIDEAVPEMEEVLPEIEEAVAEIEEAAPEIEEPAPVATETPEESEIPEPEAAEEVAEE